MKVLVTGGAGFIGSHLVEKLIKDGHNVLVVDDLSSGFLKNLPINRNYQFIKTRIQDIKIDQLPNIEGVYHLAAQASVPVSVEKFYESSLNNLDSSLRVFEITKLLKIPVVYASSSAVYGNLPVGDDCKKEYDIISPYAQDKLTMEDYANMCWRIFQTPSIGLRFFNVYGPRQDPNNPYSGVISIFVDRLIHNKPVTINGGYQTRDFIYVKDVVDVMVQSMEFLFSKKSLEVVNVGMGKSITIDHLLAVLADIMDVQPEVILKELPPEDPEHSGGIYDKLNKVLNIDTNQFIKLEKGLNRTIEFVRKNQSI